MDYRFFTEIISLKPELFRAMLNFNREFAAPVPEKLASLGTPFTTLWNHETFRRAWFSADPKESGYWNFSEESQRLALLDTVTLERLCLLFSAAVHAEELARVIAREQVLDLRREIGADVFSYALKRGRYQIGALRDILTVPTSFGTLGRRIGILASSLPALTASEWPEALKELTMRRTPCFNGVSSSTEAFCPALQREQRRALWFTMKKLLLREVAPEWAPCFD